MNLLGLKDISLQINKRKLIVRIIIHKIIIWSKLLRNLELKEIILGL